MELTKGAISINLHRQNFNHSQTPNVLITAAAEDCIEDLGHRDVHILQHILKY